MTEYMTCHKIKCKKCGWTLVYAEQFVGRCKCKACGLEQTVNFKKKPATKHMGPSYQMEKPSS